MAKFLLGNARHQLDDKAECASPAKFREALGGSCCILPGQSGRSLHRTRRQADGDAGSGARGECLCQLRRQRSFHGDHRQCELPRRGRTGQSAPSRRTRADGGHQEGHRVRRQADLPRSLARRSVGCALQRAQPRQPRQVWDRLKNLGV